jgi:Ni/Co efflux regulator RcnB
VAVTAYAQEDHHDQDRHEQQEHHDKYVHHDDWRKGQHLRHEDWDRGHRVDDWRVRHLRRPPSGYEWRDVDGQYVMANHDGVIFQVVIPR